MPPPPMLSAQASGLDKGATDVPTGVRRVVIAQWGRIYAESLAEICARAFPEAETLACCSGSETLARLRAGRADVLLLGLTFPDTDGVDLLPLIAEEKLAARVLVACHRREEHSLQSLRMARFDGLIDTLEESVETLVTALGQVAGGEPYISPSLRSAMIDRSTPGIAMQRLTPMETRVLAEIGDGSGNVVVARHLGLSAATVQTHRRNIMHKLGVSSSARLVCEAIRLGLVRITTEGRTIRPGFAKASGEGIYPALGNQVGSRHAE